MEYRKMLISLESDLDKNYIPTQNFNKTYCKKNIVIIKQFNSVVH